MANYIKSEIREQVIQLLIEGYSLRMIVEKVGCDKNTARRYMHLIGMRRGRGHRSLVEYLHRNQSKTWWQQHTPTPAEYSAAAVLELQWMALCRESMAPKNLPRTLPRESDLFGWKQGQEYLKECKRILRGKERTR